MSNPLANLIHHNQSVGPSPSPSSSYAPLASAENTPPGSLPDPVLVPPPPSHSTNESLYQCADCLSES